MCSGLEVDLSAADWAQNFVRIDSGEVDAFISNVTVTEERKEKYDFATYRLDNLALEAKKGSGWTVNKRQDVAGKVIAVGSGTNQEKILVDWNNQNVAEGLEPVDIKYFQNSTDYYLALSSGRIDAYFGPNPTAQYHAATTGETEVIGTFSGAGDALARQDRRADQEGQRFGQGVRRRDQPHHRERHVPEGSRSLEPGQRGGADLRGQPAGPAEDGVIRWLTSRNQGNHPHIHQHRWP